MNILNEKEAIAVFIDRDGTIIVDKNYLSNPDMVEFYPGAIDSIKRMNFRGLKVIVVSNQSGVARGFFDEDCIYAVERRISEILKENGAKIDGFYYCPHHSEAVVEKYKLDCECRKPKIALAMKAEKDFHIALNKSFVVGDKISDMEFARNIGATAILVRTGKGIIIEKKISRDLFDAVFDTFSDAVDFIFRSLKNRDRG